MPIAFLQPGDPAPWFVARTSANARYHFDTVAGRWIVLCFFGSAGNDICRRRLSALLAEADRYDDLHLAFFGVSIDPDDTARLQGRVPGIRFFWDFDMAVSRLYGALAEDADHGPRTYRAHTLILDPGLRVFACLDCADPRHDERARALIGALPAVETHGGPPAFAPVLMVPRVFEPAFCHRLIALYEEDGGDDSGFMHEVEGKTVGVLDPGHKSRKDHEIADAAIRAEARGRIERHLIPEIRKAFNFHPTRMERYIVGCYDADAGGHFRPHRDNTSGGTAHRRFAVSINLNAEAFEGGEIRFPEYGPRAYKPPTGGAVVFSCSLLHEVTRVTAGRRHAFLPFLYDEPAAALRARNNARLGDGIEPYRPDTVPKNPG